MVNQAKLKSFNTAPKYKYGYEIPRTYEQAKWFDQRNGNTKWGDATALELGQIDEYTTFMDKGHHTKANPPSGFKKISVHLVFDVKHDGRHKARLVANGHLTDVPLNSVYSGDVSLWGFPLVLFLAELNKLRLWATDIGNAYLEAYTTEKVYIISGPEFGEREGHILVISKALYSLQSSGARWHERFADCIRELGFFPCKAEPDMWMRKKGSIYEYIAVYVDNLDIAMKSPKEFNDVLETNHKLKLTGTGPLTCHLGMDFTRDDDNTLCNSPTKYVEKLIKNYEKLFGMKPRQSVMSPLDRGDHPELDALELCSEEQISQSQSMIGSLQGIVTIGRFDVHTAVMTMSGSRIAPRIGHLKRLQLICGYL
jgi:Reverse transcriptase (RNA-dependent DNA polymerase)